MEMPEAQYDRIEEMVEVINVNALKMEYSEILEFAIREVYDRVLLYLNTNELDVKLERVVARIVSGIFDQTLNSMTSSEPDVAVKSMSDNGQSITFADGVRNYLATTEDNTMFSGFTELLAKYRRINVVP